MTRETRYRSYILRVWREGERGWRARLEPIGQHGRAKHFAGAESLLAFLADPVLEPDREDDESGKVD